jgi:hypothetical protein
MKKNVILGLVMVVLLSLMVTMPSCALMHSMFDDKVVTTSDNVKPEAVGQVVPADLGALPEEERKKLKDAGKEVVIAPKDAVIDPTKAVEITNPTEDTLGNVLSIGVGVLGKMFPGIIGLEAIGVLLSQRKRNHYKEALAALAPTDGSVDVKSAVVSVVRAMGLAHSSETSKEAYNADGVVSTPEAVTKA